MSGRSVHISVPARVHVSLLCLERAGYRRNGGFGFAIGPGYECSFEPAEGIEIFDSRFGVLPEEPQVAELTLLLVRLKERFRTGGVRMAIHSGYAPHIGMGSGTALAMAAVEGWAIANGRTLESDEVRILSRRGGTSGIGVTTYFEGGFIFEVGSKQDGSRYTSSEHLGSDLAAPLVVMAKPMPQWSLAIFQPRGQLGISLNAEDALFEKALPISKSEVCSILYEGALGLIPALLSNDVSTFAVSLRRLQDTAWKAAERALHQKWLFAAESALYKGGALCCALSSFGPTLIVLAENANALGGLREAVSELGELFPVSPRNSGRSITYA